MTIFSELGVREGRPHERDREALLYNLAACYAAAERRLERALRGHGLSPVKMNALLMIKHTGGPEGLSQQELCARMIVSAGNITRLIDRLEKESLVERNAQKGDRRVKRIRITKKGSDLLAAVWPFYKKQTEYLTQALTAADVARTVASLERLRQSLSLKTNGGNER